MQGNHSLMSCDKWVEQFSRLRSDKSDARWPLATLHRAPHKPLLLLSILDLFAQNFYQANLIEYDVDLIETFELYWQKVMAIDNRALWVLPYFHMKSEGFWQLIPVDGMERALQTVGQIKTIRQLQEFVIAARLDDQLFMALQQSECQNALRRVLIESYFSPAMRPVLVETGKIISESFEYSSEIYSQTSRNFRLKEESAKTEYSPETRSTAFRKVVVAAYNHTCAMCGLRLLTPEGRSAVEAAHIVPWSESHNDDPRNGMALCGLHHWAFDQGLVGVDTQFAVVLSPIVRDQSDAATPVAVLEGREIVLPREQQLVPAKEALRWHFKNKFRADLPPRLL
jgi:putative restriction endonuclease